MLCCCPPCTPPSAGTALNKIKGLEGKVVRVETGVKLADLHDWLAEKVRRPLAAPRDVAAGTRLCGCI
jgi:hypothetical protein